MHLKKMKTMMLKMLMEIKTRLNFCEYQGPKDVYYGEKSTLGNVV